jgi:hypothetical protein
MFILHLKLDYLINLNKINLLNLKDLQEEIEYLNWINLTKYFYCFFFTSNLFALSSI